MERRRRHDLGHTGRGGGHDRESFNTSFMIDVLILCAPRYHLYDGFAVAADSDAAAGRLSAIRMTSHCS